MEIEMLILATFLVILLGTFSSIEILFWYSLRELKARGLSFKVPLIMHIGGLLIGLLLIVGIVRIGLPRELIKISAISITYGWAGSSLVAAYALK